MEWGCKNCGGRGTVAGKTYKGKKCPVCKMGTKPRWPDYELVELPEGTVTFGTSLFMRKDKQALKILFPAGQSVTFAPKDEAEIS